MEIKILEEKENPFFERRELKLVVKHANSATPTKAEIAKELATSQKADTACVLIDYVFTKKGLQESIVKAKIYKDASKVPKPKAAKKEGEAAAGAEAKPEEKK